MRRVGLLVLCLAACNSKSSLIEDNSPHPEKDKPDDRVNAGEHHNDKDKDKDGDDSDKPNTVDKPTHHHYSETPRDDGTPPDPNERDRNDRDHAKPDPNVDHDDRVVAAEPDAAPGTATDDTPAPAAKHKLGGDGTPARFDADHHPHGPGGEVYLGVGPMCDAEHDHCMRPGVWFQADNVIAGKIFRGIPVYSLENKWFDWSDNNERPTGRYFRTKLATMATLHVGDTVVFYNTSPPKQWLKSEYDALSSSNWDVGVIEATNPSAMTFKVGGWGETMPMETGRVVIEQKQVQ